MKEPYHVLFVCTGNICRSPMAEGLLREMLPERLRLKVAVSSAGIYANDGQTAEPDAILAAQESGADIGAHRATSLGPNGLNGSDWIVVMEKRHAHFIKKMMPAVDHQICLLGQYHPSGNVIEIPDPYGGSLSHYRQSLNLIKECMVKVVALLGERVTIM